MFDLLSVSKHFDDIAVLKTITFSFPNTGLYLIHGDNGAGKSTLLNVLSGKLIPDSGTLSYDGVKLNRQNSAAFGDDMVSYLTQDALVFDDLTAVENILITYKNKDVKKAETLLRDFGLEQNAKQKGASLSSGEKQRLCFARMLYDPKPILLLDEITTNLDERSRQILLKNILRLGDSHLIIFVTHEESDSESLPSATRLRLQDGMLTVEKESEPQPLVPEEDDKRTFSPNAFSSMFGIVKEEKAFFLPFFVITSLFATLTLVFYSFFYSFRTEQQDDGTFYVRSQEVIREILEETSPIFYSKEKVACDGDSYILLDNSLQTVDNNSNEINKAGNFFSGLFGLRDMNHLSLTLIDGRLPSQNGECLISDCCAERLSSSPSLPFQMELFRNKYTIVGIYQSQDSAALASRYAKVKNEDDMQYSNSIRILYAYKVETVFTFYDPETNVSNLFSYENSEHNRSLLKTNPFIQETFLEKDPIAVSRDGTPILSFFLSYTNFNAMLFFIALAGLGLMAILFPVSFYVRNRRRFLLLRFIGQSRKRQTWDTTIAYGSVAFLSLLSGYVLGTIALLVLDKCLNAAMGSSASLFLFPFLPYLLSFFVLLASSFLFSVILFFFLSKKDISKDILEIKKK